MPVINSYRFSKLRKTFRVISRCCFAEDGNEIYKDFNKHFVWQRSRWRCRRGLLKFPNLSRYWQTRTHFCRHIVADSNVSPFSRARNICCGHKKCFWFRSETFCVCNKCFPVCARKETSWATCTMCPQQCVLVCQLYLQQRQLVNQWLTKGVYKTLFLSLKVGTCLCFINIYLDCVKYLCAKISSFKERNGVTLHRYLRISVTSQQRPVSSISKMAGELWKRDRCN